MARPKRDDPMLVRTPPTLHAVVDAMGTYGTRVGEICGTLLVRRGWVDAHVRPCVHHVYLMPYWSQIVAQQLDRTDMRGGGLCYHTAEIDGIIQGARVLRRSRVIDPANYMPARARVRLENAEHELAELAVSGDATEGEIRAAIRGAKRALAEAQEQVEADLAPAIIAAHKDAVHHRGRYHWRPYGDQAPTSLADLAEILPEGEAARLVREILSDLMQSLLPCSGRAALSALFLLSTPSVLFQASARKFRRFQPKVKAFLPP